MLKNLVESARNAAREFGELDRFLAEDNKKSRRLVFYSERDIYYKYFEDYIEQVLRLSDLDVCYITSQADDPIFRADNPRIKPFYFRNTLNAVFARLDSRALVMTNPGLNRLSIKRAPDTVNHVYVFHGIASVHKGYLLGSFDYYDTVFCIAPYQVDEIRKTEEIYGLPAKKLVVTGYPLAERIYREHQQLGLAGGGGAPICLVAPTWGPSSIMESCIEGLIESLAATRFQVRLRPHPEFIKRQPERMKEVERLMSGFGNSRFELNLGTFESLHHADVLITEHSSISFEYALGTERPVLFIDTPMRVDNPEYERLKMEPVENIYRGRVGVRLEPESISRAGSICEDMLSRQEEFRQQIVEARDGLISNWQSSAEIGARYLIELATA